jgi:hypothetical protein
MRQIQLTIVFTDQDGSTTEVTQSAEVSRSPGPMGRQRLAHNLLAALKVAVGEQTAPKHNAAAHRLLDFYGSRTSFEEYFNIMNSQSLWLELSNEILRVESDLVLAKAFKSLEPPQEPPFEDDEAINNLYFIHDRKLSLLNQSVYGLIKIQDLVNRLLHENFGGDLVDTTRPDWERTQLTRVNIESGLKAKLAAGMISQPVFDAINEALRIPRAAPDADVAKTYRNRLMHHIRPSVDYAMFFSALESRSGEELKDTRGNVVGRTHKIYSRHPEQYRFDDLYAAFSDYLDAVMAMLQKLSEIEILRR